MGKDLEGQRWGQVFRERASPSRNFCAWMAKGCLEGQRGEQPISAGEDWVLSCVEATCTPNTAGTSQIEPGRPWTRVSTFSASHLTFTPVQEGKTHQPFLRFEVGAERHWGSIRRVTPFPNGRDRILTVVRACLNSKVVRSLHPTNLLPYRFSTYQQNDFTYQKEFMVYNLFEALAERH